MAKVEPLIAFTTVPDEAAGVKIANALVAERLAACVNILPQMQSIYRWQGRVESASECLLMMKTTRDRYDALQRRVGELHPYDVPELVAVAVSTGYPAYLQWLNDETRV